MVKTVERVAPLGDMVLLEKHLEELSPKGESVSVAISLENEDENEKAVSFFRSLPEANTATGVSVSLVSSGRIDDNRLRIIKKDIEDAIAEKIGKVRSPLTVCVSHSQAASETMKKGKYFIIGRIGNLIINAKHDQPLVDIRLASASRVENVIGVMNKLMAENTDLDEQ